MLPSAYQIPAAAILLAGGVLACFFGYRLFKVVLGVFGFIIGALLVNVIWTQIEGDPHPAVVILFSVAGAVVATWLQRYVIILGTAFAGAWTILVGGLAVMGDSGPLKAAAAGDVWVAYPLNPAPGMRWLPWAWVVLGALGTLVQMRWTGGERGRIGKAKANKKKAAKEE